MVSSSGTPTRSSSMSHRGLLLPLCTVPPLFTHEAVWQLMIPDPLLESSHRFGVAGSSSLALNSDHKPPSNSIAFWRKTSRYAGVVKRRVMRCPDRSHTSSFVPLHAMFFRGECSAKCASDLRQYITALSLTRHVILKR
jgi:hypothetical protein